MLVFPNCKINLGLHVVSKREDGFHNIETVFYPVNWCDAIEIIENKTANGPFIFSQSGIPVGGSPDQNLIYKGWKMMSDLKKIPPIQVHLHKNIPMGAGLGGGSSDAAYFINLLNDQFNLGFSLPEKFQIASELGSDCAFFITNTPVFAEGKGNEFSDITVSLDKYFILVVYPGIPSNTKDAYGGLLPHSPEHDIKNILNENIHTWKEHLVNDFEVSIFNKYYDTRLLKEKLYDAGALYASLSGSGSAVFGIFDKDPLIDFPLPYRSYLQKPQTKIL